MRRRHNIILATLAVIGTIYLVVQHHADLREFRDAYSEQEPAKWSEGHWDSSVPVLSVEDERVLDQASPVDIPDSAVQQSQHTVPDSLLDQNYGSPSADVTSLPPSNDAASLSPTEPEYSFQQDLDLDLPVAILEQYETHPPHNYAPSEPNSYAYATFLATRSPSLHDPYFLAIHSLIYRLLYAPGSRSAKHPVIVFVAPFITPAQRALLSGAGALVRELEPVDWKCSKPGVQTRWKDLFAKLHIWRETDFSRILFLDADAFPLSNIDAMFDLALPQPCVAEKLTLDDFLEDGPVCEDYIFAGVAQNPFNPTHPNLNVGSMVFTPSLRMHARLMQNYRKMDMYDCSMAEQAFLNWQFAPEGPFPGTKLERQWGAFFSTEEEEGMIKVLHEKIWVAEGGWMKKEWESGWEEMVAFYRSGGFKVLREEDKP